MNIVYNIHNILKIKIENISWHLIKDLNLRYHYFTDSTVDDVDIVVTIGSFKPDLTDCFCLDRKFYIKKNYIYLKDSDKNLRWEAEIYDIEKDLVRINFNYHLRNYLIFPWCFFPDLVMELYVLQPIIEWKLSLKGFLLIHAGAVCKDNEAILLVGRGGSRKTQLVIDLLQKGLQLISDDMVILKDMQILSLPLSPGVFTFSYKYLKKEDLNLLNQIRLFSFLLKKDIKTPPIIDSARLERAFILFPKQNVSPKVQDFGHENFIHCLMLNQKMEKTSYVSYKYIIGSFLKAYEYVFPEINFNAPGNQLRQKLLDNLKVNKILPKACEFSQAQSISDLICQQI